MKKILFLCIVVSSLLASCDSTNYFYNESLELPNTSWTYADTISFDADIQDTTAIYDLVLSVKHSQEYPNQNFYLMVYTTFPSGEKLEQRLSLDFADKTGKWHGECSGDWCTVDLNLQEGAFFNKMGKHRFAFVQYMRTEKVEGIKELTFKMVDTGNRR